MSRLSIEISEQQHQQIKAMAAIKGLSIKDYILKTALLPKQSEAEALVQLEELLKDRIVAAERGEFTERTMDDIRKAARSKRKPR